jgi:hypothetical protein
VNDKKDNKDYDIDEPFKVTTPLNELQSYIESHKEQNKVEISDRMADQVPYDIVSYRECLAKNHRANSFFDTDPYGTRQESVRSIYLNEPKSFEAVRIQIKEALKTEDFPFRIRFSIGFVTEKFEPTTGEYIYTAGYANHNEARTICYTIVDERTMDQFLDYFESYVMDTIQNKNFIDSLTRFISIFTVLFDIFRLKPFGAKIIGIEQFVKNKYINAYNEYNNLCFFAALAYHNDPNLYKQRTIVATRSAKKLFKQYYKREYFDDYMGTHEAELPHIAKFFKINIAMFSYDEEKKRYYLSRREIYDKTITDRLNILMVVVGDKAHIMNVVDVEGLTGCYVCDLCHAFFKKDKHGDKTIKKHMDLHSKGLIHKNQMKFDNRPRAYIPHISGNKRYEYCLAHHIPYSPIRYFMTYDFETVEETMNTHRSDKTIINAHLHPITIAYAVCANTITSECFDARNPNWITD